MSLMDFYKPEDFTLLKHADAAAFVILKKELARQKNGIELIASENYVSPAVLQALATPFVNKYSEGYPGKRYYGGNQFVDMIENLAIERAKALFNAKFANVQPYSGSPANLAVYFALVQPGDTIMGMELASGGHLTHGFKVSFSGTYYKNVNYSVTKDGYLDYDEILKLAKKHKPKLIWAGGSAYPRKIDFKKFREIADKVGAYLAADISHIAGLVVTGHHQNPIEYAHVVTTTTHKTLRGPRGAIILTNHEEIAKKIDKAVFPGIQGGPHNNVTLAKAVAFAQALDNTFYKYIDQVVKNAAYMAQLMQERGFKVITGGTDNHLFLVDVTSHPEIKGLTGKIAQNVLEEVEISINKNAIPHDPRKPWDPSGVRIGTPAITTRGFQQEHVKQTVEFIVKALENYQDASYLQKLKAQVKEFASQFPLFAW